MTRGFFQKYFLTYFMFHVKYLQMKITLAVGQYIFLSKTFKNCSFKPTRKHYKFFSNLAFLKIRDYFREVNLLAFPIQVPKVVSITPEYVPSVGLKWGKKTLETLTNFKEK